VVVSRRVRKKTIMLPTDTSAGEGAGGAQQEDLNNV